MSAIKNLHYPKDKLHFAFLEGDSNDDTYLKLLKFKEVHNNVKVERANRSIQMPRFQRLAELRNTLIDTMLQDEDYVFWVDSDIIELPPNILDILINRNVDIVAPLVLIEGDLRFYDILAFIHKGKNFTHQKPYCPQLTENLLELDSVGTCYLVKRKVYDSGVRYGKDMSEQVTFCLNARFKLFKVYVDPQLTVLHANLPKYGVPFH